MEKKLKKLMNIMAGYKSAAAALSGGVDSAFLLKAAVAALGDKVTAVTVQMPQVAAADIKEAGRIAKEIGVRHFILRMPMPRSIRNNPVKRCYLCKKAVFSRLKKFAAKRGIMEVMEGSNFDDSNEFRPGKKALGELGVRSPLKEAGMTKKDIRSLAKKMGLSVWGKASSPCLATRFPYGEKLDKKSLDMAEKGERVIAKYCGGDLRLRSEGGAARIEVEKRYIPDILKNARDISEKLKAMGFRSAAVDLEGYKKGVFDPGGKWKKRK